MSSAKPAAILLTAGAFMCAVLAITAQAGPPPRDRHQFAAAIGALKVGMSAKEALRLLGSPDDVRTERDSGGISIVGIKEVWRYGTSGHLTTATLGQVYLDRDGLVQYMFGKGTPPPDGMFEERDLRVLLDALGQVPSYGAGWRYNPCKVIRAVNLLQPLGKEKALAAVDEFLRVAPDRQDEGREGVFLVLRTLFDVPVPPGHMPPMFVGAPIPAEPDDPNLLPRFPIAVEGDIPFLVVQGYQGGGCPEQPESDVAYFRKNGRLRAKPLVPPSDPFGEFEKFARSPRWVTYARGDSPGDPDSDTRSRRFLGEQLLRLVGNVFHVEPGPAGELLPRCGDQAAEQNRILKEVFALKVRWDTKVQNYTFLDGTVLPEPTARHYRRDVWRPLVAGVDAELIVERTGSHFVSAMLKERYEVGRKSPAVVLTAFERRAKDRTLVEFAAGGARKVDADLAQGDGIVTSTSKIFRLDEGREVQVELVVDGKLQASRTFRP